MPVASYSLFTLILSLLAIAPLTTTAAQTVQKSHFDYTVEPIPKWVSQIKLVKTGTSLPGQPVRYLLIDKQTRLNGDNTLWFKHYVSQPLNVSGVSSQSSVNFYFNPAYQDLIIHNINVERNGQILNKLDNATIRTLQEEGEASNGVYIGQTTVRALLKDIRAGDIISYSYSVKGNNPIYKNKHFGAYNVGWQVSVERTFIRIIAPKRLKLFTKVYNNKNQFKIHKGKEQNEYIWQQNNSPIVKDEGENPSWFSPYPWVQVSEFKHWKDVAKWGKELYRLKTISSPELTQIINKLKSESTDKNDYILRALAFVQNEIRYLSLSLGENSHLPHLPKEVIENRYGDCKDKSLLLVKLLKANNIKAYPALVSSNYKRGISEQLPSPGAFDHVITMVKHEGQTLWIDGTRTYQAGKLQDRAYIDYGFALPIHGRAKGLVDVIPMTNQLNRVISSEHFEITSFHEPVIVTIKSIYQGSYAEYYRYKFANNEKEQLHQNFLNYYSHYYPNIKRAGSLDVHDDIANNKVSVTETYEIDKFWGQETDKNRISSSFYNPAIRDHIRTPKVLKRTTPYYLAQPILVKNTLIVDYPEEIGIKIDETPVIFENKNVAYKAISKYAHRRYKSETNFEIKRSDISSDSIGQYLAITRKIKNDINYSLYIPKPHSLSAWESVNELKNRLKNIVSPKTILGER